MRDVDDVEAWLGASGLLARALPGFEARSSQLEMGRAVAATLRDGGPLLVEAGTGTGKTLAYLVPALLSGKTVVVSTGTKTLQDQLLLRDIPLLSGLWPEWSDRDLPKVALMKGLQNYLCLRRYEDFRRSAQAVISDAGRSLPLIEKFREVTLTGDRAELAALGQSAPIWHEVSSSSETRIGTKCKYFDACFVTQMRRNADKARLLIVNHHLFFADLALRAPNVSGVIPDYDAVIFDEAHMLEDIATGFFGVSVSTTKVEQLVRDAQRVFSGLGWAGRCERLLSGVLLTAARFFETLPRPRAGEGGRVPLPAETFVVRMQEPLFALDNALDALQSFAQGDMAESEAVAQIARRSEQLRNHLALISEGGPGDHVSWTLARGRSVSIGSSPVEVGDVLRDKLFAKGGATILTSATLSTAKSFQFVKARFGIEDAAELCLDSPFDYAEQAALYLPRGLGDPRDPSFLARAATEVTALVELTDGGAFVLCTSLRAMRELAERMRPGLRHRVLVQGEAPNASLLETFRSDGSAVLFATAGFWQGVDVPGTALRLVIIDKLPFEVPSDPLVSARCLRLKERGQEPFMHYLVPAAALTLKQGFGRLIRARSDRGIVALLDERVSTKGYGKVFLRSLPDARRCSSFEEVSEFWRSVTAPGAGAPHAHS
ncbi:MAG TPA: ATP-dependent DNA helicase [Polyangiales bacterium]|nr:ATP-dependent DNA helicase [Polyangiales bacterium]